MVFLRLLPIAAFASGGGSGLIPRLRRGWALAALAVALGFAAVGGGILLPASTAQAQGNQNPSWPQDGGYVQLEILENKTRGTWAIESATDPDGENSAVTYTYSGSGSDHISVTRSEDGSTVYVVYEGSAFDYETMGGYKPAPGLRQAYGGNIKATDADGGYNSLDVSIVVRNVQEGDEAFPVFRDGDGNSTENYQFSLRENADGSGTPVVVGSVIATDANNDDLIYSLRAYDGTDNPPAPLFSINDDGEISYTGSALDYESLLEEGENEVVVQDLDVIATDPGGLTDVARVVVYLDDVEVPARMDAPVVELGDEARSLRVSWTPPSNADAADLRRYKYFIQPTGSTEVSAGVVYTVSSDTTSVVISDLSANSYDFKVLASGSEGIGPWSELVTKAVVEPPERMAAPTLYGRQGGFLAVWTALEGDVDRYTVKYRKVGSSDSPTYHSVSGSDTSVRILYLEHNVDYQVRVRGVNAAGKGQWSPATVVRTNRGFTQDGLYHFELPENASGAETPVVVGSVAVGGYGDVPVTFTIAGIDDLNVPAGGGDFRLDSSTGVLTYVGDGEDHESLASRPVRVKATAAGYMTLYARVIVNVADVRERPERMAAPTVSAQSNHRLDVSWVAPNNAGKPSIESYEVKYRLMPDGQPQVVSFDPASSDFLSTVINAGAEGDYRVRIRALSHEGHGRWSPYTAVTACSTCP